MDDLTQSLIGIHVSAVVPLLIRELEAQGLQEILSIEPEPEPEKMPTWAEIFAQESIEGDAVKLGIPVQIVRRKHGR